MRDRLVLGFISGLGGTVAKNYLVAYLKKRGLAELNGIETAAGILLPGYKVATPGGKVVGHIVNMLIGGTMGVGLTYLLSTTGNNNATFKGASYGACIWGLLYGAIASMGGSAVRPVLPKTLLSNLAGHITYGVITSSLITRVGDEGLFNGTIPLFVNNTGNIEKEDNSIDTFLN